MSRRAFDLEKETIRDTLGIYCNNCLDILRSQLGNIFELLAPPLEQRGWLIQEFMSRLVNGN